MHGQIVKPQLEKKARVKIQADSSVPCEPRAKVLNCSARTKCPVKFFSRELVRFLHCKLNLIRLQKGALATKMTTTATRTAKKKAIA